MKYSDRLLSEHPPPSVSVYAVRCEGLLIQELGAWYGLHECLRRGLFPCLASVCIQNGLSSQKALAPAARLRAAVGRRRSGESSGKHFRRSHLVREVAAPWTAISSHLQVASLEVGSFYSMPLPEGFYKAFVPWGSGIGYRSLLGEGFERFLCSVRISGAGESQSCLSNAKPCCIVR